MRKYPYIGLILLLVLSACRQDNERKKENQRFAINEMLLLRTEGLALAEMAVLYTDEEEITLLCDRITQYYKQTHPDFLGLCQDKELLLEEDHFDSLTAKIDHFLQHHQKGVDVAFLELYRDNAMRSIALYEIILHYNDWEDMTSFSFLALPDLYNQQEEVLRISHIYNGVAQSTVVKSSAEHH